MSYFQKKWKNQKKSEKKDFQKKSEKFRKILKTSDFI